GRAGGAGASLDFETGKPAAQNECRRSRRGDPAKDRSARDARAERAAMRWLLAALALLMIGLVFGLGLLVYAMYVLLAVLLVSRYLTRQWIAGLEVERACD